MIELKNISFDHIDFKGERKELLRDISFKVNEGERIVLLGINGSGKSTLLKIMDALIFPKSGQLLYQEEIVDKKSIKRISKKFRKEVVFLMQDPNMLLFNATVKEEIAFGLREFGFDNIDDRVIEIAKKFSLTKYLNTPPFFLSGGEKQRVALASLLVIEPKLLLMDEPSANLDPTTTAWLVELLDELEITTITSTHNLSLAHELGNRALVLNHKHRLIFNGDLDHFLQDKELLIKAKLLHRHTHYHHGMKHSHYHLHDW